MKYDNACDVLPEALLKEVQKYAAGRLPYIPSGEERRAWGESSGYREQLQKRNRMIRNQYAHGTTITELADEYFLSLDSIKKIIYSKKRDSHFTYYPTVESAVQYANAGLLEEWVHCYQVISLNEDTAKNEIGKGTYLCYGVVQFPLRLIQWDRAGVMDADGGIDPSNHAPPLLVVYEQEKFTCTAQPAMFTSLKQRKVNAYPTIIVLNEHTDYNRFMTLYGNVLFYCAT